VTLPEHEPLAAAVSSAIRAGAADELLRLLQKNPELSTARIVDGRGTERTLLHIVTDWPGHLPNGPRMISAIVAAGGNPNAAAFVPGAPHAETPLHWAASNDDVAAIDALLRNGSDIESPGAVFTNGSPLSDAVVFGQWQAARRLLERGARVTFWQAAALGAVGPLHERLAREPPPSREEMTNAFWNACRGGSREAAELLLFRGADRNWVGHGGKTPLDAARESGRAALAAWLREIGARTSSELSIPEAGR